MSTIVDTAGVPDARTPRHRHPGLYVPLGFWVMYVVGIIGCSVDATLARSVINKGFHLDQNTSTVIVVMLGAIAAEAATAQTDRDAGNQTHDEIPATAMMLGLYCVSMISVFLAAIKIFHPARWQLRKHDKQRRKVSQELAPLEADLVAIHERIATRAERFKKLCEQREQVQRQVDAREGALKAFSRDAIARALGDPSSTPLVRAPHEPGETPAGSQGSPMPPRPFPV